MQYRFNLQETGGWASLMQGWEKEMQLWRGLIYKQQLISVGLKHKPDVNDESSVSKKKKGKKKDRKKKSLICFCSGKTPGTQ